MGWTSLDTWIAVAGILGSAACALLGNFLVLRRMSMMGDAISHAVLPGIAAAFLLTGSRESLPMFIGAAAVGVLTALFTQWVNRFGKVEESASMGVVFTALFAVGLILIVRGADAVDLDPGCVLYGAIELVPLDTGPWGIPRAVTVLGAIFLLDLAFVALFYKELKITTFDPALATSLGIDAGLLRYLLMSLVAVTAVACFESVGSIIVIAMLIVPAATAYLLADRLLVMIVLSVGLAALSAVLGHAGAITVPRLFGFSDTLTSGMMAVASGALFLAVLLLSPRHGVITRILRRTSLSLRILEEDLLGLTYRLEEAGAGAPRPGLGELRKVLLGGRAMTWLAASSLRRQGKLSPRDGSYALTEIGRAAARDILRSHRLWESYLNRYLGLAPDHVHPAAERLEHVTDPVMQKRLADRTAASVDPHGREIPPPP